MLPVLYEFYKNPRFHGVLFRRTFPQLEESLIKRSYDFYSPLGGIYNEQKKVWTFPEGAQIRFRHLGDEEAARARDTAEFQYAGYDELTEFEEFNYIFTTSRVRSTINGIPAIVRGATNPGNLGHVWVRDRFVIHCIEGGKILKDKDGNKRIFIRAFLTDNPYLMEKDPAYYNRLKLLPEAERKAKLEGDWFVFSGQVFNEFRLERLKDEPAHAVHVIDDFEVPIWWPRIVAVDWGFSAHTWAGWGAISPDRRLIVYREGLWHLTPPEIWGADIRRYSQHEESAFVSRVLDPSAWQRRSSTKTIAAQVEQATGWTWEQADNDRIGGKVLIHEFLRWRERPPRYVPPQGYQQETADWLLRNKGPEALESYQKLFEPEEPELNLPKVQIMKSCQWLTRTIPLCVYKQKSGENTEDVAEWRGKSDGSIPGDDPYDGFRYLVKAASGYLNAALPTHARLTEQAQIVADLQRTGDWTTYHRRMAQFEAKHSTSAAPLYRGSRRRLRARH